MPSAPAPLPRSRPRRRVAAVTAAAVAFALVTGLAACSDDGSDGAASSSTTVVTTGDASVTTSTEARSTTTSGSSTTTSSTTTEPTTSTTSATDTTAPGGETTSGLGTLPEGTHYGYFTGVTDGQVEGQQVQVVSFDKVEFLTGDAAVEAAAAQGETVENDYFIVNDNTMLRLLPVIPDGQVFVLQDGTPTLVAGSVDEAVNKPDLYKIEVVAPRGVSLITSIEAVFLP